MFSAGGSLLVYNKHAVQKGETIFHYQEVIRHPDGSSLPVLVNAVRLAWSSDFPILQRSERSKQVSLGEPAVLVVHQDVTVLKEAEDLKDEFMCIATHELRTPLTVLMGYTDLLLALAAREQELTDRQKN
jgi:signal transduction histidine kinase